MKTDYKDSLQKNNQDAALNTVWLFVRYHHEEDYEEYNTFAYSNMDKDSIDRIALDISERVDDNGTSCTDAIVHYDVSNIIAWSVEHGTSEIDLSEYETEYEEFRLFRIGVDTGEDEKGVQRFYVPGADQRADVSKGSKIYALLDHSESEHVGAVYSVRNPAKDMMELDVR